MILTLARELVAAGHAVDLVLAGESQDTSSVTPGGVRVVNLEAPSLRRYVRPFIDYLRSEQPVAVVASLWPFTSLCVVGHRLARSNACMVVMDHNTMSMQFGSRGLRQRLALRASLATTYRLADVRIAVSKGVAADSAALAGIRTSEFAVQYNPLSISVDPDAGSDVAEDAWNGWTGRRILTVGRFKPQKNHKLLIQAFKKLLRTTDAELMIVGMGSLEAETAAFARKEGLADRVLFPGHFEDVAPFYKAADLFVLSSDYEGFGNVIVEALAFGLPVVSTDCHSGPAEILDRGVYGTLVPVGDADALAEGMAEALGRDHDNETYIRRAADFSPRAAADALLESLALSDSATRA